MVKDEKSTKGEELKSIVESKDLTTSEQIKSPEKNSDSLIQQSQTVETNTLTFDKWVESIISDAPPETLDEHSKKDYRPTVNLSRFGLNTPEKVKLFLHSPAGEATIGEIGAQFALEKAIQNEQRLEQQEHRLLMSRIKALLFLWFITEEADAANHIKEIVIQQNEKAIEKAKTPTTKTTIDPERAAEIESIIDQYNEAIKAAQTSVNQGEILDKKMKDLVHQGELLKDKYNIFETSLEDFEKSLAETGNLTQDEIEKSLAFITQDRAKLQQLGIKYGATEASNAELIDLDSKISNLKDMLAVHQGEKFYADANGNPVKSLHEANLILAKGEQVQVEKDQKYLLKPGQTWDSIKDKPKDLEEAMDHYQTSLHKTGTAKIEALIHKLSIEMEKQAANISAFNEGSELIPKLMNPHIALNLKVANLHDMLAVHKGHKYYANDEGVPVNSLEETGFLLNKDQQIVKHNDKHYLLQKGQDFNSVKENPEALAKAQQDFEKIKHEIMTVKKVVQHNKQLETTIQIDKVEELSQEIAANKSVQLDAANQIRMAQTALSNMQNPNYSQDTPIPRPTSSPKVSQATINMHQFFKNTLIDLRAKADHVTYGELADFSAKLPAGDAKSYLSQQLLTLKLTRNAPIPETTMKVLLQNLERFGIDATKPSVTSTLGPMEQPKAPSVPLTPFKTKLEL